MMTPSEEPLATPQLSEPMSETIRFEDVVSGQFDAEDSTGQSLPVKRVLLPKRS